MNFSKLLRAAFLIKHLRGTAFECQRLRKSSWLLVEDNIFYLFEVSRFELEHSHRPSQFLLKSERKSLKFLEMLALLSVTCFSCLIIVGKTSAISNTHCFELSPCGTFYLVPSSFSLTSFINPFGISNSPISNFYCVEQFCRPLQSFSGCLPSTLSITRMMLSNESYCLFKAFEC